MNPIHCVWCGAISWGNSRYKNKACVCKYCRKVIQSRLDKGWSVDEVWEYIQDRRGKHK